MIDKKIVTKYARAWVRTTVLISPEFYRLCKDNRIKFSEAMRMGISLALAEKGIKEYDNNLNIVRKRTKLLKELEETAQKLNQLERTNDK